MGTRILSSPTNNVSGSGAAPDGVSFRLLMGGTDEVAATTDSSSFGHSILFNNSAGNAVIDTAQSVGGSFPGSSFRCDATIDSSMGYMYWADHNAFALGSGDFTLEFFFRHNGASYGATTRYLMGQIDDNGGTLVTTNSSVFIYISNGRLYANAYRSTLGTSIHTGLVPVGGVTSLSGNTWYYGCYTRQNDTFYLYLGTPGGTATLEAQVDAVAIGALIQDSSVPWGIGICGEWPTLAWYNLNGGPNVSGWSGWIGPSQLWKGRCLYPGGTSYTVPTSFT